MVNFEQDINERGELIIKISNDYRYRADLTQDDYSQSYKVI